MSSIKDVAKKAGVSIATVSRYINSPDRVRAPTAKRVKETIKITGYEANSLARNFRAGKTQHIMVVLPSIGTPFNGPVMEGVRKVADSMGAVAINASFIDRRRAYKPLLANHSTTA
jgi:LacI family repressor for deo operon, udp, cdd, tsx, nupC, and nupG